MAELLEGCMRCGLRDGHLENCLGAMSQVWCCEDEPIILIRKIGL